MILLPRAVRVADGREAGSDLASQWQHAPFHFITIHFANVKKLSTAQQRGQQQEQQQQLLVSSNGFVALVLVHGSPRRQWLLQWRRAQAHIHLCQVAASYNSSPQIAPEPGRTVPRQGMVWRPELK